MTEALATWVHARSPARDEAKRKLAALPLAKNGKGKAVPFPFADKQVYKKDFSNQEIKDAIASAPERTIPLDGIYSIQHSVQAPRVARYIDHPHVIPEGQRHPSHRGPIDHPIVIQYKGVRFAHDGNHRLTAAKLSGARSAVVRFVDLDRVEKV